MDKQCHRFQLGQVCATPGALNALQQTGQQPSEFLDRHVNGDWGKLDNHEKKANHRAIEHEGDKERQERVLSAYGLNDGVKIWVITEWDRSVTTLLLPEEY